MLFPLILSLGSLPALAFDAQSPRARGAWIDDPGDLIPEADEAALNARIGRIAEERGVEPLVAIGSGVAGDLSAQSSALLSSWGLSGVAHSRALVLTLDTGARRVGVATVAGGVALPAGWPEGVALELRDLGAAGSASTQLATVLADVDAQLAPRAVASAPAPRPAPAPVAPAAKAAPPAPSPTAFFSPVRILLGLALLYGAGRTAYGRSRLTR